MSDELLDPGVLSLSLRRRHRDLEQENELMRGELTELRDRLRKIDGGVMPADVTRHSSERCSWHLHVIVDEKTPRVECAECGAQLDPHAVLLQFAKQERRFRFADQQLVAEHKRLAAEVEHLKRQRTSLRSQIRKKGGTPIEPWELPR